MKSHGSPRSRSVKANSKKSRKKGAAQRRSCMFKSRLEKLEKAVAGLNGSIGERAQKAIQQAKERGPRI